MFETRLESWVNEMYAAKGITAVEDLSIEGMCEVFDIHIVPTKYRSKAVYEDDCAIIFLKENMPIEYRRKDFFHELGHIFQHVGDQRDIPFGLKRLQEEQVFWFSLYASMPEPLIRQYDNIHEASRAFELPILIVKDRLQQLRRKDMQVQSYVSNQKKSRRTSYDPDKWTSETWRIMNKLKKQTGQEVIDYESLL
ncbi:ImmA/IrrE family metallo-endopeptidase [Salibacterium lacus]|uniref:ImmA/IrrE family metallo-endopeptidase n=1 Tax=Salibacterium lacus TaxID=1898109 RepID=A0ABW5SX91_9BACI